MTGCLGYRLTLFPVRLPLWAVYYMFSGSNKAVDIVIGVLQTLLMVLKVAVVNFPGNAFLVSFTKDIAG